jgi:hypothetical protein
MSDVPILRLPSGWRESMAGLAMLRLWGVRRAAAATPEQIELLARDAGFVDVRTELVGDRVIAPAFRAVHHRLDRPDPSDPVLHRLAARTMLHEAEGLWERGTLTYLLLSARKVMNG